MCMCERDIVMEFPDRDDADVIFKFKNVEVDVKLAFDTQQRHCLLTLS